MRMGTIIGSVGRAAAGLLGFGGLRGGAGACGACGYDLKGLEEERCPECGRGFAEAARGRAASMRVRLWAGALGCALLGTTGAWAVRSGPRELLGLVPDRALCTAVSWTAGARGGAAERALVGALGELGRRLERGGVGEGDVGRVNAACAGVLEAPGSAPDARLAAAAVVTRLGPAADHAIVGAALLDEDPAVRVEGVRALGAGGGWSAEASLRRLTAMALGDGSPAVRRRAIDAARSVASGREGLLAALIPAIDDPDKEVRERAVLAMGEAGERSAAAARALARAAQDREESVRTAAVWSLGRTVHARASSLGALRGLLRDPSPEVRAAAAWRLASSPGWITGPWAGVVVGELAEAAVEDESDLVRAAAAEAASGVRVEMDWGV